ncbi:MAG: hypothetical protein KUG65_12150 [Sphingomonadaceae bacterium]|nr:hypothetical protein [Sphingomonadaceae bacterium]
MSASKPLWSLWDMIQLLAQELIASAFNLGLVSHRIAKLVQEARTECAATVLYDRSHMDTVLAQVQELEGLAVSLSLPATHGSAVRLSEIIGRLTPLSEEQSAGDLGLSEQIAFTLHSLHTTLTDELRSVHFVSIVNDHIEYLDDDISVFGEAVDKKFPKMVGDISEAAKCLAFGRNTACVFHLMRVMEHCVQRLGRKLKVKVDVDTATWYKIGNGINKAVSAMHAQTAAQQAKKQKYALAYANLDGVRMAWRNDVMHPKATYTEEEARNVFSHVGAFLKSLAPLV